MKVDRIALFLSGFFALPRSRQRSSYVWKMIVLNDIKDSYSYIFLSFFLSSSSSSVTSQHTRWTLPHRHCITISFFIFKRLTLLSCQSHEPTTPRDPLRNMPQSHTAWDTPEEVLTVYYASRNVHRETIVDIMLLKFSHQRDAKQIANKLQVIRSKEREEGRPDFVSPKGAWQLFPVDAWMLQKISDEAELRELIKWTPEVEVAIKKVRVSAFILFSYSCFHC